jgi:hypothetical protein
MGDGTDMIGMDNLLGTFFTSPFTSFGKGLEDIAAGDQDAGLIRKGLAGVFGAAAESFGMSSAALNLVMSVARGSTSFGTPVRADTVGQILRESFLPPMVGGYEHNRLTRVAGGNDINPQTYEKQTFWDFVKARGFGIRKMYGTPQRLQSAYHNVMSFRNKDAKGGGTHVTDELFEERKHSLIAHGAVDPITGEVDDVKQREILQKHLAERQTRLVAPDGSTMERPEDLDKLNRAIEATKLPKVLYNVNRENVVTMMQVYAMWRRADHSPEGEWDHRLNQLIVQKIQNGSVSPEHARDAVTFTRDMLDKPGFPDDAKRRIQGWSQTMVDKYFKAAARR